MRNPTDLEILSVIHEMYYNEFANFKKTPTRLTKNYVGIDTDLIGKNLGVDGDIVWSRLYYHLEKKHGYRNEDKSYVHFFYMQETAPHHQINFPYMAAALAELQLEDKRYKNRDMLSIWSIGVSFLALALTVIRYFPNH